MKIWTNSYQHYTHLPSIQWQMPVLLMLSLAQISFWRQLPSCSIHNGKPSILLDPSLPLGQDIHSYAKSPMCFKISLWLQLPYPRLITISAFFLFRVVHILMNFCLKLFVGWERFIGVVRHSIIYMTSVQFEEQKERGKPTLIQNITSMEISLSLIMKCLKLNSPA